MGTTADKLNKLLETKAAIKQAIRDKGVHVDDYAKFAEYPNMIRSIETGGSSSGDDFFNLRTQNGYDMSNLFYGFTGYDLDVSNLDTSNANTTEYMFASCSALMTLNLSSFNTSNVRNMNSMLYCCSSLTELDLSNFDTSCVTIINSMFCGCTNLQTLNISNFNLGGTDDIIYGILEGCDNLHTLRLDNCDYDTIRKIIESSGFPTGTVGGVDRKMYVNPYNVGDLTAPDGWRFEYV